MIKFMEIITGWRNLLFRDDFVEEVALDRLEVCSECKYNTTYPDLTMLSLCKECGCVLEAKARNLDSNCPKAKWKKLEKVEQ